ncbi:MAG: ABC transporter ATP-binding protein [Deltaproteobacteria bacterium]|nr:ABC transporter ATP-binding protein [Deltaproteobacteria bacterium]
MSEAPSATPKPRPGGADDLVMKVFDLAKTFRLGFFRKRIDAVRGVSFHVRRGEIFGVLGPNGAGKTTTLKVVVGLIFPTSGSAEVFGMPAPSARAARRIGFLPESPYFYEYLKPTEFLDFYARLFGMPRDQRRKRARDLLGRVGLAHALDRPLRKFSKGMLQRVGLAQALINDPELLILDEPMTGLDPIGRKEVRDLILEENRRGKTIVFSSHILSDVEMLCHRVAIIHKGKVVDEGPLTRLLRPEIRRVEVDLCEVTSETVESLRQGAVDVIARDQGMVTVVVEGESLVGPLLTKALAAGAQVVAVTPRRETLEDLFVRRALEGGD